MKIIKKFYKYIISAIYPNQCKCCGEFIDEDEHLCDNCEQLIERNDLENLCLNCGFEKSSCVCKYNVYRFNSLVCVYKNTGFAQKAYYKYKFGKKRHYVDFFADEMCSAINFCYNDITFDYVCEVPSNKLFSYNHSGYLAQEISKKLCVPYANKLLFCAKRKKKQHRSTIEQRLSNVEGKYSYKYRVDNKKILLVDDIKTTGATLDECAKMLLYAGAECVFCITVLGTPN